MNNAKLSNGKVQWLTFLVYFLLSVLSAISVWHQVQIGRIEERQQKYEERCQVQAVRFDQRLELLPRQFVQIERYLTDKADLCQQLRDMNNKLDRLIERTK